ncbi:MAG: ATPase, T2SS/T4P/T4SS family [Proteobacteria bacterium]|nr:ATPase, T2SS/T4P/T4SS family [Pseudomonadota bacterium]
MSKQLLEYLHRKSGLSKGEIQKASNWATANGSTINYAFEKLKLLDKKAILKHFSNYYNTKVVIIQQITIDSKVLDKIPRSLAKKELIIPIDFSGKHLVVAMADPSKIEVLDSIRFQTGIFCRSIFALESDIRLAHQFYYKSRIEVGKISEREKTSHNKRFQQERLIVTDEGKKSDGPVIKLVNDAILSCIQNNASDIHFEAYEKHLRVRIRTDGMLQEIVKPPLAMREGLISRIKIMSGLDIAETRLPQDGSLTIQVGKKEVAFRVNSAPCINGEKIVMRILDNSQLASDIRELGFEEKQFQQFNRVLSYSSGMILVTGPTGSGKTTTLYSALSKLNEESVNIMTAEDPVEFLLPNVNQVAVKPSIGLTFSAALRAFLRQDPDIIMVGEIRDIETADIAIKASLTGHVVLSTVHTNSAPATITRLMNMGVPSYNITGAIRCVMAQRLLRRLCKYCKVIDESVDSSTLMALGMPKKYASKIKVYREQGCPSCSGSGVSGRVAIYEILELTDAIKTLIIAEASTTEIKKAAMATGMKTLRQSAITKMAQGLCSLGEVLRVTDADAAKESDSTKKNKVSKNNDTSKQANLKAS